jgi:nicotinamidase-related amidase
MLNRPQIATSLLVLIDVQEKFAPAISDFEPMLERQALVLNAARELKISVVANEQYPKGLGHTMPVLTEVMPEGTPVIEKTSFSCFGSDSFRSELAKSAKKTLILMGIETHVCVQQTAFDALNAGYEVILLADATGSRKNSDKEMSFALMRQNRIMVTTVESFLFAIMGDATHPAFKAVSKLVK